MLTFKKINDFQPTLGMVEYGVLLCVVAVCTIAGILSLKESASGTVALLSLLIFVGVFVTFTFCHLQRRKRAISFYTEWLQSLSNEEISTLQNRLKPQSEELLIIARLQKQ
ncbi:hypothetical protein [Agaribacter flavus]|uniref:Uncharacterized protein n=1 Tax=Agaribacter flavus TaxID=1902781 RepID=A0ABV7FLP3_9ALTE